VLIHRPRIRLPKRTPGWKSLGSRAKEALIPHISFVKHHTTKDDKMQRRMVGIIPCSSNPADTRANPIPVPQLTKEDEQAVGDEVEVRREDQDKINKFSRLHQRELKYEEELKAKSVGTLTRAVDPRGADTTKLTA
jgi:hypothetical protein